MGLGVRVAAGVDGDSGRGRMPCAESRGLIARSAVTKDASESEWTLTSESEADESWSGEDEDLRWRCEGARTEYEVRGTPLPERESARLRSSTRTVERREEVLPGVPPLGLRLRFGEARRPTRPYAVDGGLLCARRGLGRGELLALSKLPLGMLTPR